MNGFIILQLILVMEMCGAENFDRYKIKNDGIMESSQLYNRKNSHRYNSEEVEYVPHRLRQVKYITDVPEDDSTKFRKFRPRVKYRKRNKIDFLDNEVLKAPLKSLTNEHNAKLDDSKDLKKPPVTIKKLNQNEFQIITHNPKPMKTKIILTPLQEDYVGLQALGSINLQNKGLQKVSDENGEPPYSNGVLDDRINENQNQSKHLEGLTQNILAQKYNSKWGSRLMPNRNKLLKNYQRFNSKKIPVTDESEDDVEVTRNNYDTKNTQTSTVDDDDLEGNKRSFHFSEPSISSLKAVEENSEHPLEVPLSSPQNLDSYPGFFHNEPKLSRKLAQKQQSNISNMDSNYNNLLECLKDFSPRMPNNGQRNPCTQPKKNEQNSKFCPHSSTQSSNFESSPFEVTTLPYEHYSKNPPRKMNPLMTFNNWNSLYQIPKRNEIPKTDDSASLLQPHSEFKLTVVNDATGGPYFAKDIQEIVFHPNLQSDVGSNEKYSYDLENLPPKEMNCDELQSGSKNKNSLRRDSFETVFPKKTMPVDNNKYDSIYNMPVSSKFSSLENSSSIVFGLHSPHSNSKSSKVKNHNSLNIDRKIDYSNDELIYYKRSNAENNLKNNKLADLNIFDKTNIKVRSTTEKIIDLQSVVGNRASHKSKLYKRVFNPQNVDDHYDRPKESFKLYTQGPQNICGASVGVVEIIASKPDPDKNELKYKNEGDSEVCPFCSMYSIKTTQSPSTSIEFQTQKKISKITLRNKISTRCSTAAVITKKTEKNLDSENSENSNLVEAITVPNQKVFEDTEGPSKFGHSDSRNNDTLESISDKEKMDHRDQEEARCQVEEKLAMVEHEKAMLDAEHASDSINDKQTIVSLIEELLSIIKKINMLKYSSKLAKHDCVQTKKNFALLVEALVTVQCSAKNIENTLEKIGENASDVKEESEINLEEAKLRLNSLTDKLNCEKTQLRELQKEVEKAHCKKKKKKFRLFRWKNSDVATINNK